jgi:hypothetical protein
MGGMGETIAGLLMAIIPSFCYFLLVTLVFASLGLSIGFRKLYIYVLLTIFEVIVDHLLTTCLPFVSLLFRSIVWPKTYRKGEEVEE